MSLQDDRQGQRRRKSDPDSDLTVNDAPRGRKRRSRPGDVGGALRSAYQRVVAEEIPPEMLDLLGKLG